MFLLSSCENLILSGSERITFALVIDDPTLAGKDVEADVHLHDEDGTMLETVEGTFASKPGSDTALWAEMTTVEDCQTNERYHLIFWIDIDGDDVQSAGDRTGYQTFEVMPNEPHSEAKSFAVDLVTL